MKLTKKQQEFIKEAATHSDVCENWKNRIKATFPELFNGLKVGKWYKEKDSHRLVCYQEEYKNNDIMYGYGFGLSGWNDNNQTYGSIRNWTSATDKEVEEALIKEAKKRGFKIGTSYKDISNNGRIETICEELEYCSGFDLLTDGCGGTTYSKGQWSTVIKNAYTKEEAENKFNILI
ncbi:MAG: hypothetical protein GY739_16855, partial [Mesoflavibacter sp.]|nr:hypothetical protein [Mesoflavibacter sp.]